MTGRAARSSSEQHEAPSGTLGQRVGLAGHEPIVGRTARDDGAHVGGQRAGDVEDGRFAAEGAEELLPVPTRAGKGQDRVWRRAELVGIQYRAERLLLERGGATVPEEAGSPRAIHQRRHVAGAR